MRDIKLNKTFFENLINLYCDLVDQIDIAKEKDVIIVKVLCLSFLGKIWLKH